MTTVVMGPGLRWDDNEFVGTTALSPKARLIRQIDDALSEAGLSPVRTVAPGIAR